MSYLKLSNELIHGDVLSSLTLSEFRLMIAMLAKANLEIEDQADQEKSATVDELCEAVGMLEPAENRKARARLKNTLLTLKQKTIYWHETPQASSSVDVFSTIDIEKRDNRVRYQLHPRFIRYVTKLGGKKGSGNVRGFTQFDSDILTQIDGITKARLYLLLKSYAYKKGGKIEYVDFLRRIYGPDQTNANAASITKTIKRGVEALNAYTDLNTTYKIVNENGCIKLCFYIEKQPPQYTFHERKHEKKPITHRGKSQMDVKKAKEVVDTLTDLAQDLAQEELEELVNEAENINSGFKPNKPMCDMLRLTLDAMTDYMYEQQKVAEAVKREAARRRGTFRPEDIEYIKARRDA